MRQPFSLSRCDCRRQKRRDPDAPKAQHHAEHEAHGSQDEGGGHGQELAERRPHPVSAADQRQADAGQEHDEERLEKGTAERHGREERDAPCVGGDEAPQDG